MAVVVYYGLAMIVDGGDERAGGHGGVNVDLVEQHRDHGADQTGNDHSHNEGDAHTAREQERLPPGVGLEEVDIHAQEAQRHHGQQRAVDQAHPHFLEEQVQLFAGG